MLIRKHRILPQNIWNFDEKGFLIGLIQKTKRIVPLSMLKSKRTRGAIQDGSREFLTLIACVNALGDRLPPSLIYKSQSGDLQTTWLDDFDEQDPSKRAYFAASEKGWTSNIHGRNWLERFEQETGPKSIGQRRLLILDGHSSHVDMLFIERAIELSIYIVVFPPHSTHRLQPLDVSVFRPLAQAYSKQLDDYVHYTEGLSSISKRLFWKLFWPAWDAAVSESNIRSGFTKTGIYPYDPSIVLKSLAISDSQSLDSSSIDASNPPKSYESRLAPLDIRRIVKTVKTEQPRATHALEQLIRSVEELSLQNDLLMHQNKHLNFAVTEERARRKRGKGMGLIDEDQPKFGQFFSPEKLSRVKQVQADKIAVEEAEKLAKQTAKMQKQLQKQQLAQRTRENRAKQKIERARARAEEVASKQVDRQLRVEARHAKQRTQQAKKPLQQRKKHQKRVRIDRIVVDLTVEAEAPILATSRSGRNISLPKKFLD